MAAEQATLAVAKRNKTKTKELVDPMMAIG